MTPAYKKIFFAFALAFAQLACAESFRDRLDTPAQPSKLAARAPLLALAQAGSRIVAAGPRGHIVYSDDQGKSWQQAEVPLSSDLLALSFPSSRMGWAVGHDGVILHSTDGGAHWQRQLDGRTLGPLLRNHYARLQQEGRLGKDADLLLADAERLAQGAQENPFLDVWFTDERSGFAVGAFNLILHTEDGGAHWTPWLERTANPQRLHIYAVRSVGGHVYAAGEQGLLMRLDGDKFSALDSGYRGSFFGLAGGEDALLAFGLRGHLLRSADRGKSWQEVGTGVQDGITGGSACTGARRVLATQSGRVLVSEDGGQHVAPLKLDEPMPAAALLCAMDGTLYLAGARGVRALPRP